MSVSMRFSVLSRRHFRKVEAITAPGGELAHYAEMVSVGQFRGDVVTETTVRVATTFRRTATDVVPVTLEMLGDLFKHPSFFPRATPSMDDLNEIERLARLMRDRAEGDKGGTLVTNLQHNTIQDSEKILAICQRLKKK